MCVCVWHVGVGGVGQYVCFHVGVCLFLAVGRWGGDVGGDMKGKQPWFDVIMKCLL